MRFFDKVKDFFGDFTQEETTPSSKEKLSPEELDGGSVEKILERYHRSKKIEVNSKEGSYVYGLSREYLALSNLRNWDERLVMSFFELVNARRNPKLLRITNEVFKLVAKREIRRAATIIRNESKQFDLGIKVDIKTKFRNRTT